MNLETALSEQTLSEKRTLLFDETGRFIPRPGLRVYNQVSRGYFNIRQPELNYGKIHASIQEHLQTNDLLSAEEFETRSERILENLQKNESTRNLLKGIRVPFFCTPDTQQMHMGQEINSYLKAVGSSFKARFPEYTFTNYCESDLPKTTVVPNTHYEKFIEARKKGSVVGWYFPNCLSEYAVPDQRTLMKELPDSLILSGAIDSAAAIIGSPDLLMKRDNFYPPLLCLASLQPPEERFFYHFEAYGWNLTFNQRSYIGAVAEYWAGGLTVIG